MSEAILRLRPILYVLVIAGVVAMFIVASWISQRLFRAWEAQESRFRKRDRELSEELKLRVEELQRALTEKGILLREVQHRVKNNLQLISSLASLQSRQAETGSAAEALRAMQERIRSMSLIHEGLCFSETLAEIDFAKYVDQLGRRLVHSCATQRNAIELHIDVEAVLRLDEATPCGMIINELLSNSLKHAFADPKHGGDIWITVREQNGDVMMEVRDNGIGMPAAFSLEESDSLGLLIVTDLTAQLHGEITWINDGGAVFRVHFRRRTSGMRISDSGIAAVVQVDKESA
jgi:two-component sensor histidine kinase